MIRTLPKRVADKNNNSEDCVQDVCGEVPTFRLSVEITAATPAA